jgi:hypothetical protein
MSRDKAETKEGGRDPQTPAPADEDGRELDQRIAMYLGLGLPASTVICAVAAGVLQGAAAVVLVLCAGALMGVIALFWASIRTLVGETPLSGADAYALGAPRAEEEQKRAVLRALKDLEFERSVGKISDEDYQALVAKYRADAKRLLRTLDEDAQPRREKVADLVAERLFEEGLAERPPEPYRGASPEAQAPKNKKKGKPAKKAEAPKAEAPPAKVEEAPAPADTRPACAECSTRNDADAAFCKKCGARLGVEEEGSAGDAKEKPSLEETS